MEHVAKVEIHAVQDGDLTRGWVHTHGMFEYDLPELEMRHVPLFLAHAAAQVLQEVCDYMLTAPTPVLAGQTMRLGRALLRFAAPVPIPGAEEHYQHPCLQIVDADPVALDTAILGGETAAVEDYEQCLHCDKLAHPSTLHGEFCLDCFELMLKEQADFEEQDRLKVEERRSRGCK